MITKSFLSISLILTLSAIVVGILILLTILVLVLIYLLVYYTISHKRNHAPKDKDRVEDQPTPRKDNSSSLNWEWKASSTLESQACLALKSYTSSGARFLTNCYIPTAKGTTEIDALMISHSGIYVLECKNYNGSVAGEVHDQNWIQKKDDGQRTFYNPIKQNDGHIRWLQELVDTRVMHSLIVFKDGCDIRSVSGKVDDDHTYIVNLRNLKSCVEQIDAAYSGLLSSAEIAKMYQILLPYSKVDDSVKQKHLENIPH